MSFINPTNKKTDLTKISMGEYFNQPTNSLFPSWIDVANVKYLSNDANSNVRDYSWDGETYSGAVNQFDFQPLSAPEFANFTSNDSFQHFFPSSALFYMRTVFEHGLQFSKTTRLTYPEIVNKWGNALSEAALTDKDAMNLWEIAYKYANCLTTGRFIVIPDADYDADIDIMSDAIKADKLTNFWVKVEQKLSGLRTPYYIGVDQKNLKLDISQNLYQILMANNLAFNGSDKAYEAMVNNEFISWRGLSQIKTQWYYQKPVPLNTFKATSSATFNGTQDDVNINKIMDYSFIGNIAGFLQADNTMVHAESPKIEENDWAIANKHTITKGWFWMCDHGVLPTKQPFFWMILTKAPTYQDYKNAWSFVTALQPSLMGLYVNNPNQKVKEGTSEAGNGTSTYDKMGWNDFTTLRTLKWDSTANTYKLGQGTLTASLKNDGNVKYNWIKDAQTNIYNYLFGSSSLFFVNDPNVALASGNNLLMLSAENRAASATRLSQIDEH